MIRYCLSVSIVLLLFGVTDAIAQRVPNINRRPVISPYLQLFNNNRGGGAVSTYFNLVRPMQEQARINQMQRLDNRSMEQQLQMGNQQTPYGSAQFGGAAQSGMLRPTNMGIGQASTAATYFNYSHFYNMPRGASQGSRRVR